MRIDRVKLITEMARADVSVNDLAAKTGLSRNTITAIRRGKTCTATTSAKVANGLGVPVTELLAEQN